MPKNLARYLSQVKMPLTGPTLEVGKCHVCLDCDLSPVVDFTKSRKSKISRKCEFQPIKSLEITLTITLTINLRLTTFCEIDPWFVTRLIQWVPLVEQELFTFPEHPSSPLVFSAVCFTRSLVLCVCFVDHCLSF